MSLVFPPSYIEDAVNEPVTTYTRRCDIYESDGTTLWLRGAQIESATVTVDMDRKERRTADVTFLNDNGALDIQSEVGLWYDKVIKLYMGVAHPDGDWETCIGTFLIDRIASSSDSQRVKVTLRDFSKKLQQKLPFTLAWPTNEPIEEIIEDLAIGGGLTSGQIDLPLTGISTEDETSFTENSDRWDSMQKIATAHGYDLFFTPDGVLTMQEFTDPFLSPPQYTFQVGALSNISHIDRQVSDSLIKNHIVVVGETPDGIPVWGEALNYEPTSPTRITRLGFRTERYENNWVTNNTQAVDVATRLLKVKSLERYEADLDIIIVPWLDVNVTVEYRDPNASISDPTRYLLSEMQISWDLKAASVKLGRVKDVINADPLYPDTTVYPATNVFPGVP